MFSKTALISLILGVLYANALTIPVAREPAPEPYAEIIDDLFARGRFLNTLTPKTAAQGKGGLGGLLTALPNSVAAPALGQMRLPAGPSTFKDGIHKFLPGSQPKGVD